MNPSTVSDATGRAYCSNATNFKRSQPLPSISSLVFRLITYFSARSQSNLFILLVSVLALWLRLWPLGRFILLSSSLPLCPDHLKIIISPIGTPRSQAQPSGPPTTFLSLTLPLPSSHPSSLLPTLAPTHYQTSLAKSILVFERLIIATIQSITQARCTHHTL